jgi:hypothetical protein
MRRDRKSVGTVAVDENETERDDCIHWP